MSEKVDSAHPTHAVLLEKVDSAHPTHAVFLLFSVACRRFPRARLTPFTAGPCRFTENFIQKEIAVHLNSCLRCQLRTKENLSEIAKMQTTLKKANESGDIDDKEDDVGDKMDDDKEEKEKHLVAKLSGEGAAPSPLEANMCSCVTARDTLRHQQAKQT